jgi:hypothetical protein
MPIVLMTHPFSQPLGGRREREVQQTLDWVRMVKATPVDRALADRLHGKRLLSGTDRARLLSGTDQPVGSGRG